MPDFSDSNSVIMLLVIYGGVILAAAWLAMIIWTYRDMRARSRDRLAQLLVAVMVAILTFPGVIIYILLRPRETMAEAYERSLEEEALLQEIEEKPSCPGCGQRTHPNWQVCPNCHTRLKKPCGSCGRMLELSWTICPFCAASQNSYEQDLNILSQFAQPAPRKRVTSDAAKTQTTQSTSANVLEFIDGDDH